MVAQIQTASNTGPDFVCMTCGKPLNCCTCRYVDLAYSPDGWHWRTVNGHGALPKTSHIAYATRLEAATAGAFIAFYNNMPLRTGCNALNESLVACWQIEGIEAAQRGEPLEVCWNKHQRDGYGWAVNA